MNNPNIATNSEYFRVRLIIEKIEGGGAARELDNWIVVPSYLESREEARTAAEKIITAVNNLP